MASRADSMASTGRRWARRSGLALLTGLGLFGLVGAASTPRELGQVDWERDFAQATARADASGKPLFALFQEIPGCQTCVSFGEQVLGHPLLVEAIEREFVPVAIYNNRPGADRALLERFGEPSWNNPVVRFLSADGADLIARRDRIWEPHAVGARMIAALEAAGRAVPAYLVNAVDELRPRATRQATFAMYCFWSGEACLGGIDGLMSSRTGYLQGHEVVEVTYDPKQIEYAALVRAAHERGCADLVFAHDAKQRSAAERIFGGEAVRDAEGYARTAKRSDQKRQLRGTPLADLALTPRQALQANSAMAGQRPAEGVLSPRQRETVGTVLAR